MAAKPIVTNIKRRGVVTTVETFIGLLPYAWLVGLVFVLSFWFWVVGTNETATMHYTYGGRTSPTIYTDIVGASLGKHAEYYLNPTVRMANAEYGRVVEFRSGRGELLELWLPMQSIYGRSMTTFLARQEGFYKDIDHVRRWE